MTISRSACALLALAMTSVLIVPHARASQATGTAGCPAPQAKKKAGFAGLLGAAKRAGAGNFLGRGIIPQNETAKVAGEIAGKAIEGAANAAGAASPCPEVREQPQQREWRAID